MVSLDWVLLGFRLLTTIILYTFLGLAFYIIWRDLKQLETRQIEREPATDEQVFIPPKSQYQLRVIASNGDQSPEVGRISSLQTVTGLGRAPDNTVVLNDDSASSYHARIRRENGVWWLEDLGSRNGTMLNDLPLSRPASLVDGDVVGIGKVRLMLEIKHRVS